MRLQPPPATALHDSATYMVHGAVSIHVHFRGVLARVLLLQLTTRAALGRAHEEKSRTESRWRKGESPPGPGQSARGRSSGAADHSLTCLNVAP